MAQWWMRTGAAPARLALIPYGVDTSVFRPIADAKTRLGIAATEQTILYAGRLSPEKHVAMLIRLLARIEHSQATLHILGTGPLESELQRMANELRVSNRVRFHGQVALEQMPLWYSAADLMILPSSSEGLPRVMLEALACGAPFIGTRITGIVDVIEDGKNGLLIDPGDDAALLTAALSLLDNQRFAHDLGARALSDIRASYSWDSTVRQFRSAVVRELRIDPKPVIGGVVRG
jgi:glycosyltransferase involved in cell wall biosynthesis